MSKKGQFFTIDAVIALAVLGVGVIVLILNWQGEPLQRQSALYASDLVQFYTGTRFDQLPQDWAFNLWCTAGARCYNPSHVITHPHQSLFGVLTQLTLEGRNDPAKRNLAVSIARNVSRGLVQSQFNWEVNITTNAEGSEQFTLANRTLPGPAQNRIASKTIIYFTNSTHGLEGPYVGQIVVWQ
jgi:hypothetical protein